MKVLLYTFCLIISFFAFSQEIFHSKNVNQFAIYPGCEEDIDNFADCFYTKLNEEVTEQLVKIKMNKLLQKRGEYYIKLNFVIDENGKFINVTSQGNEILGRTAIQILYRINREQEEMFTKIKPALVDEKPVKVSYSISILYNNQ